MESAPPPQRVEDAAPTASPPHPGASEPTLRWRSIRLDPLLLACFAVLLAFPLAAAAAASREPIVPERGTAVRPPAAALGPTLRDVPAFTPDGDAAAAVARGDVLTDLGAMREELAAATAKLFDRRAKVSVESLLRGAALGEQAGYPYRWPRLDPVLDAALPAALDERAADAANDLGALLMLAAARFPGRLSTAAHLAFAVLHRARAANACLPQLNLGFLVATDVIPNEDAAETELREAARRCPGDPTPLWLLGQFQSQRALFSVHNVSGPPGPPAEQLRHALATFETLRERFPQSSAGWAGAADTWLRVAYQLGGSRHFTLRSHYRRALALYRRARALDPDPALAAGEARAQAGLRLYAEAARSQRQALEGARRPAQLQARLVEYLERAGAFAPAATEAGSLTADPRFPRGPALFMEPQAEGGLLEEDGQGALSHGSGRVLGVTLHVTPRFPPQFTDGGGLVLDLSFVPRFREVPGLTGYHRWCPGWQRRRDLFLARRFDEAVDALPRRFVDVRPRAEGAACPEEDFVGRPPFAGSALLAALAELERGEPDAAVRRLRSANVDLGGRAPLPYLQNARQNVWRFAGDLDRARAAAEEWMRASPTDSTAFDRAGEIAFLGRDFERAAERFGAAARLARATSGSWSNAEAAALLKRGTALELAGRYADALAALAGGDEVASRVDGLARRDERKREAGRAAYLSYNARLQLGDTHLRAGRFRAALEQYAAARERERDLDAVRPGTAHRRPEVLDNNQAVVELRVGTAGAAVAAAQRALRADRKNPIFLQTLGLALERIGRPEAAVSAYRAAVREEPTLYPAWNDLGVALARQGSLDDAADAFRHAVGVRPEYGVAWFNLGVALERIGLRHALASQGAFGRAVRADAELRGRERTFVAENEPYFTTLDLSKPLPPKWQFARTQERAPVAAAGFAVALLLALQLSRTLLSQARGGEAERWLGLTRDFLARLPRALATSPAAAAVAATAIVFLLPLLRSPEASLSGALLLLAGVALLIAIVLRARVLGARRAGVSVRHSGWSPGIVAGVGLAGAGLPWAPLPVAETSRPVAAIHWLAPIAAGAAALSLLALGVAFEVPATRALGAAALVMTASMLTPIEPLDGGFVARGTAGIVAGLAALGTALFLLLGLS